MTLKAYCDRCRSEICDNDENCSFLEFCDVSEDWKAEGNVECVALLCGGCVVAVRELVKARA